ncbi:uncharacterized protein LOC135332250 [Halichondria panicea]|uniref:uncharacterized protein LOC135332250 n=1 Tax=Halichondria panicea TaxID=6063 RepID=UPI00312BC38C
MEGSKVAKRPQNKLLKRLLAQPKLPTAKKPPRKPIEDPAITERRKRETEFINLHSKVVHDDEYLASNLNLTECKTEEPERCLLVITNKTLCSSGKFHLVSRYRLVLSGDGSYFIQAFHRTIEEGTVATPSSFQQLCEKIADQENYKMCPGLPMEEYNEYSKVINHDETRVLSVDAPVPHVESPKCHHLHIGTRHMAKAVRKDPEMICQECIKLRGSLQRSVKRFSTTGSATGKEL